MLKRRVLPEDVIINCSKDSEWPEPPEGHKWKEVRHDNSVTWLASWTENIQNQIKYVMLNPSSKLWETPSPESMTIPVVRPEAYKERTAWMATYMAGMLKVSNMIWVIFSRLALGLRGASVRRTGCSSGATRSSL